MLPESWHSDLWSRWFLTLKKRSGRAWPEVTCNAQHQCRRFLITRNLPFSKKARLRIANCLAFVPLPWFNGCGFWRMLWFYVLGVQHTPVSVGHYNSIYLLLPVLVGILVIFTNSNIKKNMSGNGSQFSSQTCISEASTTSVLFQFC